jgi:membrane protein
MTYWRPLSLAWKALNGMIDRNGIEIAGYIAFTVMLAIFPFMIFVVSIAGFFGETQTGANFLNTMALFAPPEMMKTLLPAIQQVTQNRSGSLLTIGLALALYSAGSAVSALRLALNLAYGLDETRSLWWRKSQDFLIVMFGSALLILLSFGVFLWPWVWRVIAWFTFTNPQDRGIWLFIRYAAALVLISAGVIALHRILPNTRLKFRNILPGALTTTAIWIVAVVSLTLYFGKFANYDATYGSLGGVIVTLMFFYISAIIFIFGGELNAALLVHAEKHAPPPNPELQSSLPLKT